jgi:serine protease Do
MVANTRIGEKVSVRILRKSERRTINVVIGKQPSDRGSRASRVDEDEGESDTSSSEGWGLSVEDLTPQMARRNGLEVDSGVVVTDVAPDGPAAEGGIQPGDVIREVNGSGVQTVAEFEHAIDRHSKGTLLLLIQRGSATSFHALKRR